MKDTIIDSFLDVVARFPEKTALLYKKGHHFESLSYEKLYFYGQKLAVFLKEKGIGDGDNVVLIAENRPEWVIADVACLLLGAVLVPVHQVLSGYQMSMIIEETEPKIILGSNKDVFTKILEVECFLKKSFPILYFENDLDKDEPLKKEGRLSFFKEEVYDAPFEPQLEPVKHDPNRVVTIIYTSGTTGPFKGVPLTNKNFISNITGVLSMVEVTENDKFLSILPLSHVFERTVGYYIALLRGATVSYVLDPAKLSEIARQEKPTIIIAVPRLYEKVYAVVKEKAQKSPIKKLLFGWAFKIGETSSKDSFPYKLADKIVFKKVKAAFGGNIRFFVSGAASLAPEIGSFFDALNIPVLEGYGLTETSPIIACNTVEKRKYGTVGLVLPNVRTKIVQGELYIKGENVFEGYYKKPEKTKEAFTKDGWFKTGDLVEVDADGFLKFRAREKEIIALSTGKKLSPAFLEEKLELAPSISQAFVFGDSRKHVGALIVPEKEKLKGISQKEKEAIIQKEIDEFLNCMVSGYEQIKKFVLIEKPFTVENGLLTPTLKLRRKDIVQEYVKEIESIYL